MPGDVYIIAELGVNHDGEVDKAAEMLRAAAEAGVNAVKLQSFTPEGIAHPEDAEDQVEFFRGKQLTQREHLELKELAGEKGVELLSTPFEPEMVELLEELEVPRYKISSSDLNNLPLIRECARTKKPLIISTGMGTIDEAERAAETAVDVGAAGVTLLHCVSLYPTPPEDARLHRIGRLKQLGHPVGFSDHTVGDHALLAAVALGASVLEKHFCMSRSKQEGPDIPGSLEPEEMNVLVDEVRELEEMLAGDPDEMSEEEAAMKRTARRSLYWSVDREAGHTVVRSDLVAKRPAHGLGPDRIDDLIGRELTTDVEAGGLVDEEQVE